MGHASSWIRNGIEIAAAGPEARNKHLCLGAWFPWVRRTEGSLGRGLEGSIASGGGAGVSLPCLWKEAVALPRAVSVKLLCEGSWRRWRSLTHRACSELSDGLVLALGSVPNETGKSYRLQGTFSSIITFDYYNIAR